MTQNLLGQNSKQTSKGTFELKEKKPKNKQKSLIRKVYLKKTIIVKPIEIKILITKIFEGIGNKTKKDVVDEIN